MSPEPGGRQMTAHRSPDPRQSPLHGIKVLDLSRFIAGPFCSMILGDMGADVIKVEGLKGEESRHVAPHWNQESIYTMTYNRNKRAITLDTRSQHAAEVLERLVAWADVIVENYRPGVLAAMGLAYETLRESHPGVIVTSVSGFGQTGPMKDRPLFDCIAQAVSGLMHLNARPDEGPVLGGFLAGDHLAGIYATLGTVLALYERRQSGLGQHVDVAVLDSLVSCLGPAVPAYAMTGKSVEPPGNRDVYTAPGNMFETTDGNVYIHAGTQPLFERLCTLLNRPELIHDPRFSSVQARVRNAAAAEDLVREAISGKTAREVDDYLGQAGIPVGVVAELPDVINNPQLVHREMMVLMDAAKGEVWLPGSPVKLSETPASFDRPPPTVSQHTEEVLMSDLGFSQHDFERLRAEGAI